MFECQFPDGICSAIALLRSLDPVGPHLNDDLSSRLTERLGGHTATQLSFGIKEDKVLDPLLVKRSSSNDTRHATTEDEDSGVIGGRRRVGILGEYS